MYSKLPAIVPKLSRDNRASLFTIQDNRENYSTSLSDFHFVETAKCVSCAA